MPKTNELEAQLKLLKVKLSRMQAGKEHAEDLLESKSRALFHLNEQLNQTLTDLQQKEQQLIQQEKLASIGQLAAGVAHELNTPAGFSISNLETLKEYLGSFMAYYLRAEQLISDTKTLQDLKKEFDIDYLINDIPSIVDESLIGLNQIAHTVKGLRTYAHQHDEFKEQLSLDEIINTAIHLVSNSVKLQVAIKTDLHCDDSLVSANSNQLCQVLINLIVNANQAIKEQGEINVKSWSTHSKCLLSITDNGVGIEQAHLNKIFDPFFTTKPVGKGTGLGLSISHNIIKQHNGTLSAQSVINEGTTFTIELPKLQEGD